MAKRKTVKTKAATTEHPSAIQPSVDFTSHMRPVLACSTSVRYRSFIEIGGILLSIILGVVPMSGLTRSGFLLIGFAMLIDVVWRSIWTHMWRTTSKVVATSLLTVVYVAVAATLILQEHPTALAVFKAYVHSDNFARLVFLAIGFLLAVITFKLLPIIRGYVQSRRAEELARRLRAQKGWLDYRIESEKSSRQLHDVVARINREFGRLGQGLRFVVWMLRKDAPGVQRANLGAYLISRAINIPCKRIEKNLEELLPLADLFVETTEGHLKSCRHDYDQLSEAHNYFEDQLKSLRDSANKIAEITPALKPYKGVSQQLTAAVTKFEDVLRIFTGVLRRIEGHCARMAKLAEHRRDRELVKPLKQLASNLVSAAVTIAKDVPNEEMQKQVQDLRRKARAAGIRVSPN